MSRTSSLGLFGQLGLIGLLCVLVSAGQARAAEDPGQQVDALHAVLVQAMKHGGTLAERTTIVDDQVLALFDFETIARISVGREWTRMQAPDQARLIDLLRRLSVATYADRFDKFEGQRFERQGVQTSRSGSVVKTVIVRSNGERVSLHYYFRAGKIFNVVADGVSDLALRRSDYGSILKREGLPALFKHVEDNVAELE